MTDADSTDDGLFPIPERRIEQGFLLMLLAWVSLLLYDTRNLSSDGRLMPLLVGVPTLTLIVLVLLPVNWSQILDRLVTSKSKSERTAKLSDRMSSESGNSPAVEQRLALALIGWGVALVVLIRFFGFYYTLPPYTFALTWYLKRDLKMALLVTVVFVVVVWFLFIYLFEQFLFRGTLDLPLPRFL